MIRITVITTDVALGMQPIAVELRRIRQGHPVLVTVHQILDSIKRDLHFNYCTYNNTLGQPTRRLMMLVIAGRLG
jgi:hypothetical protein